MIRFTVTPQEVSLPVFPSDRSGAFVTFEGKVRDNNQGQEVLRLEYEAYSAMAEAEGSAICTEAASHFGLTVAVGVHRTGILEIGETALVVTTAAPHREAAIIGCEWIVEQVKVRLPVWKREHYATGASEWLGCQPMPDPQTDRYARQTALPQVGPEGQKRLADASVLVIGAGGLGSAALPLLAGAGVGTIGIAEQDTVEAGNLSRQTIYTPGQQGMPKAVLAAGYLAKLNPGTTVRTHPFLDPGNAESLVSQYEVVVDCSDNFATKFLANDTCVRLGVPLVQASIHGFQGHLAVVHPEAEAGCLRCLWPDQPEDGCVESCGAGAVFGPVAAVLGGLQASEALKVLLDLPSESHAHLVTVDLLGSSPGPLARSRSSSCPACGLGAQADTYSLGPATARQTCDLIIDIGMEPGAVACATAVPWSDGLPAIVDAASRGKRIAVVCEQGFRSAAVARHLRSKGHESYSVIGGRKGFDQT